MANLIRCKKTFTMDNGLEAFTEGRDYEILKRHSTSLELYNNEPWRHNMNWDYLHEHFEFRKIYLCGPITGIQFNNKPAFFSAERIINELSKAFAINPHTICSDIVLNHNGTPAELWQNCMKADIAEMLKCDAVALLPGWQKSRGANIESTLALQLGLDVKPIDEWYQILGV